MQAFFLRDFKEEYSDDDVEPIPSWKKKYEHKSLLFWFPQYMDSDVRLRYCSTTKIPKSDVQAKDIVLRLVPFPFLVDNAYKGGGAIRHRNDYSTVPSFYPKTYSSQKKKWKSTKIVSSPQIREELEKEAPG